MTIRELRKAAKLTQVEFANLFDIPLRTLQDWEYSKSTCAEYTAKLIEYYLTKENLI